jgi:hypothetical protein
MPEREMGLAEAEGWLDYWETVGLSSDPAALDEREAARLIRAELARLRAASAAPETSPARNSDVEAWLKQARDFNDFDTLRYLIIDELLDDYRLHADTGTPLSEHACDGPTCCSYLLEAREAIAARSATPPETTEH